MTTPAGPPQATPDPGQMPMVSPAQLLGGSIPPQAHDMLMGLKGAAHAGQVPMQPAGGIEQKYPQLRAKSTVDWHRVNPRLLQLLNKQGEKTGDVIVLSSGYRDNQYNAAAGGHPQSNHRLGLSVDAHINGHPIGEVIDPQSLIKVGLHVGGPNGDPSHVDLSGIPIKNQQKAQPSSGKESAPTPPPGPGPGPGADAGGDPLAALMAQMQASGGPGASNQ